MKCDTLAPSRETIPHLDRPSSHQKRTGVVNVTVQPSGFDPIQVKNSQWGYSINLLISHSSLCSWEYPFEYVGYQPATL
jgi:hypothetical protein